MKKILILGSTGSIGVNTLNVIRQFPSQFKITGLSVNSNISELKKQADEFHPEAVAVRNKNYADKFSASGFKGKMFAGDEGLIEAAKNLDYDILVSALVGFAGLLPTIEAIKRGKKIALANKETLVVGGEVITNLCKAYGSEIIPVDSEHSAIFQCLVGEKNNPVEKIILTASGGPFLNYKKENLSEVTVDQALNHPNWKMGSKITIDSASMMNKGLEVIEAHWLFDVPVNKIDVVIHPQSIIHSMVQFEDGSIKAQLGLPDMKLPIQYALTYPDRLKNNFERTELPKINALTFFEPDMQKFECLKLAYDALQEGGTAPCILNAANEVAVSRFLNKEIKFLEIPALIKEALNKIKNHTSPEIESIIDCDKRTRELVTSLNF